MKTDFSKIYNEIKYAHSNILPIDNLVIEKINNSFEAKEANKAYYPATFTALFLFATAPGMFYYNLSKTQPQIDPFIATIASFAKTNNPAFHVSSFFVFLGVICYTILFPHYDFGKLSRKMLKIPKAPRPNEFQIEKTASYYAYAGMLNYFNLFILFAYLSAFQLVSISTMHYIVLVWVLLPTLSFCIFPTAILAIILLLGYSVFSKPKAIHPFKIIFELASLLKMIDSASFGAWNDARAKISSRIDCISNMIVSQKLHYNTSDIDYQFISLKYYKAASRFRQLKILLYLQSSESKRRITVSTIRYLNVFISGNMLDLPDEVKLNQRVTNNKTPKFLGSIIKVMLLGVFLSIPVVIWVGACHNYHIQVDSSADTLIRILYAIWSILGIVSFSEHLAPETKSLFFDIARGIAPKWKE
jgi:hypothetical protein